MTFLEKLDFFLQREHLNRRGLSQKTGIPYTTIDNWYNRGYEGLRLSTAGRLAEFFGTTTDFLLRDDLTDPDYGKALGFQVDFGEMERVRKYRALDMYGKQAVDAVLEAEHQPVPVNLWETPITPRGWSFPQKRCRKTPTAACGSAETAWSQLTRMGTLCSFSAWKMAACGKGKWGSSP